MRTAHEWIFPAAILNSIVLNSFYGRAIERTEFKMAAVSPKWSISFNELFSKDVAQKNTAFC